MKYNFLHLYAIKNSDSEKCDLLYKGSSQTVVTYKV